MPRRPFLTAAAGLAQASQAAAQKPVKIGLMVGPTGPIESLAVAESAGNYRETEVRNGKMETVGYR